jgi:hypothetical protein
MRDSTAEVTPEWGRLAEDLNEMFERQTRAICVGIVGATLATGLMSGTLWFLVAQGA